MKNTDVTRAFVGYLEGHGFPGLKIDSIPDIENRTTEAIDAIAGPFAIEHTSIDALPDQRERTARYLKVAEQLKLESPATLSYRIDIAIEDDAIAKGPNWGAIGAALARWAVDDCAQLTDGHHEILPTPDIPFDFHVWKSSVRPAKITIGRFTPPDATFVPRLRKLMDRKAAKLSTHQGTGVVTVLLLENDDLALMNTGKLVQAIRDAYGGSLPPGVDQLWYADTSIPEFLEFADLTSQVIADSRSTIHSTGRPEGHRTSS